MAVETLHRDPSLTVRDYRCTAHPHDRPFVERHEAFTIAYVRRGSFGCHARGAVHELVAGSLFVGHPGDEYACTHEHHGGGDECLSFHFAPALVDALDHRSADRKPLWRVASVPPLAEIVVLGELAQAAAEGRTDVALEEAGMMLAARFATTVRGKRTGSRALPARDRRRSIDAARWIELHAHEPVTLASAAAHVGLSDFHFLRLFRAGLGVTPHQYLVRCRLRRAARLLSAADRPITDVALDAGFGDLSNFIRTFGRAARMSPRAFRRLARSDRNAVVERLERR